MRAGGKGSRWLTVARVLLTLRDRVPLDLRDGLEAGHECHHAWCVNVRHLRWQTHSENLLHRRERDDYERFSNAVDELADKAS